VSEACGIPRSPARTGEAVLEEASGSERPAVARSRRALRYFQNYFQRSERTLTPADASERPPATDQGRRTAANQDERFEMD